MDGEPGEHSQNQPTRQREGAKRLARVADAIRMSPRRFLESRRGNATQEQIESTPFDYPSAVADYILRHREKHRSSRTIAQDIPTLHGIVRYTNENVNRHFVTDRSGRSYDAEIFSDEYESMTDAISKKKIGIPRDNTSPIAGGKEYALGKGRTVLDLGSGEADALFDYAYQYPETTFIGIDANYDRQVAIQTSMPGVQLSRDTWDMLENIPDHSVDTILSVCGVSLHGIGDGVFSEEEDKRIFQNITRVSKTGTIFRFGRSVTAAHDARILDMLHQNGWEVFEAPNNLVAVKR